MCVWGGGSMECVERCRKTHNQGRRKKETGNPGGVDFIYQVKTGDTVVPI